MTGLSYRKRYRMELDLNRGIQPTVSLPRGFYFVPWNDDLLAAHAETKWRAFRDELDCDLFPGLHDLEGCMKIMEAVRYRSRFVAAATWLVSNGSENCATIQGIRDSYGNGAIQNLGVPIAHRGQGIGTAILLQSLVGFQSTGVRRVVLEVTTRNAAAIAMYRRVGFRCRRTLYKTIPPVLEPVADAVTVR